MFDFLFLPQMDDSSFLDNIVGADKTSEFFSEQIESKKDKKRIVPMIYHMIEYFDISKDVFVKFNNQERKYNEETGFGSVTYTDEEIEVLFCGDEKRIIEELRSPYTLNNGKELFTVYEISRMDANELKKIGVGSEKLEEYVDWIQSEMDRMGYSYTEDFFIKMRTEIDKLKK